MKIAKFCTFFLLLATNNWLRTETFYLYDAPARCEVDFSDPLMPSLSFFPDQPCLFAEELDEQLFITKFSQKRNFQCSRFSTRAINKVYKFAIENLPKVKICFGKKEFIVTDEPNPVVIKGIPKSKQAFWAFAFSYVIFVAICTIIRSQNLKNVSLFSVGLVLPYFLHQIYSFATHIKKQWLNSNLTLKSMFSRNQFKKTCKHFTLLASAIVLLFFGSLINKNRKVIIIPRLIDCLFIYKFRALWAAGVLLWGCLATEPMVASLLENQQINEFLSQEDGTPKVLTKKHADKLVGFIAENLISRSCASPKKDVPSNEKKSSLATESLSQLNKLSEILLNNGIPILLLITSILFTKVYVKPMLEGKLEPCSVFWNSTWGYEGFANNNKEIIVLRPPHGIEDDACCPICRSELAKMEETSPLIYLNSLLLETGEPHCKNYVCAGCLFENLKYNHQCPTCALSLKMRIENVR